LILFEYFFVVVFVLKTVVNLLGANFPAVTIELCKVHGRFEQ